VKQGKGWLDVYYLDVLVNEAKYTADQLEGLPVDWHGRKGVIVKRPNPWRPMSGQPQEYVVGVRVRVPCDGKCGKRLVLTVVGGVHYGAFCTVVDRNGTRLADLRDCNSFCAGCAK
jgi:hypothetical protein